MKINLAFKNDDKTIPVGFESNDNGFGVYVGAVQPVSGHPGKSAYEVALENGFEGTEEEWLNSLKGENGFSPIVDVSDIEGGHRVTVTDKDGEKTFDVMDGAGGGTVHWDDIEDKPFGEMPTGGDTLYWDGNTDGLLEVTAADRYGTTRTYYKVSDAVPTWNDLLQGNGSEEVCLIKNGSSTLYGGAQKEEMMAMIDDCLRVLGVAELYLVGEGGKIASLIEEIVCVMEDNYTHGNFNFPEKGTYFSRNVDTLWLRGCTSFPSTKLMDKKYLPMDDITAAVLSALPIYNGEVEEV